MSYQVLARKYRPKNFDTLVGQEHVVRALTHALQTQRLHHAYLFTGTRGVGKTTLSRILAKSFNCIGPDGQGTITAQPCGVCEVCLAVDAGRFVDYIEMDAASNRGVDEMAQLLEQAVYAPSNARFKVYMIDEVHMLTNTAFNAMLKTLEEPPPHIKFILATTDPQKIPVTVLSRCLQFNLKQMPPGHIIKHLENILGLEQIEAETPALRLLAQGAHGSMRDALSLTDQAIAYAAGKVTLEAVQGMLGALDQSFLLRLLDALAREDGPALLAVADEMATRSLSYNTALQDLASLLHQIALAQTVPQAVPDDLPEREEIMRLAQLFDAEEVQLFYQIAVHGRNELGMAPDEYAGFSMTLLRMLAFRPSAGAGQATPPAAAGSPSRSPAPIASARPASAAAQPANPAPAAARPATSLAAPAPASRQGISPAMAALQAARGLGTPNRSSPPTPTVSSQPEPAQVASNTSASVIEVARPVASAALPTVTNKPSVADDAPPWDVDDGWSNDGAAEFFGVQLEAKPGAKTPSKPIVPSQAASLPAANAMPAEIVQAEAPSSNSRPSAKNAAIEAALRIAARGEARVAAGGAQTNEVASEPNVTSKPLPQATAAPEQVAPPFVKMAVPHLSWDGDWPMLAASLPVRGIVQQLAWQSELLTCLQNGGTTEIQLRTPLQTLCTDSNIEKLSSVLSEHFGQVVKVSLKLEGPVWHTANARAEEARAIRMQAAEKIVFEDDFVQGLLSQFGAYVVPESIKPIELGQPS